MDFREQEKPVSKGRLTLLADAARARNKQTLILLGLATLLVGVLVVLVAGVPLATSTDFCGTSCHAVNPEYQSWKRSSHSEIACYFCHSDQSYVGLGKDKFVDGPRRFFNNQNDTMSKPINADNDYALRVLTTDRCLRCHSPRTREFSGTRGLNVTSKMHVKHVKAGLTCATCHNRVAHLGAEKFEPLKSEWPEGKGYKYKNFMTMRDGCWRCHSGDPKYRNAEALSLITNGKKPPTGCKVCHNREWNLKPVAGEYDHNDVEGIPWKVGTLRHGPVAKKDFNACFACHPQVGSSPTGLPNCSTTCHGGITMPHNTPKSRVLVAAGDRSDNWLKTHYKVAEQVGKEACMRCHNSPWLAQRSEDFCMKCHHKEFYEKSPDLGGPWIKVAMPYVKKNGAGKCWKCHQPEFCVTCHVSGQKPPPGKTFIPTSNVR